MKAPITYTGYNDKNECIATITGQDANNFINPAEVKSAIENVKDVMEEQLGNVSKALRAEVSAAETAIIVKGTHMGDPIEDTASSIDKLPNAVYNSLEGIYEQAETAHDKIQDAANDEAKSQVQATAGFHHFG